MVTRAVLALALASCTSTSAFVSTISAPAVSRVAASCGSSTWNVRASAGTTAASHACRAGAGGMWMMSSLRTMEPDMNREQTKKISTFDLLLDFDELYLLLQDCTDPLDAFLLTAGMSQITEDYLHRDVLALAKIAQRAPRPLGSPLLAIRTGLQRLERTRSLR